MAKLYLGNRQLTPAVFKSVDINNQDKTITENGTYTADEGYTGLGEVLVNVPSSGIGITREVSSRGVYQIPNSPFTFTLPNNAIDVGDYALQQAFYNGFFLTSVDLSSLISISGNSAMQQAFSGCNKLTSIDLSGLTTVSGTEGMQEAFKNCLSLISVDLSSLTTISGSYAMQQVFLGCSKLTSIDLSGLTTISGDYAMNQAFSYCTQLTSVDLSSLTDISGTSVMSRQMNWAFSNCTSLATLSFPALTSTSFGSYTTQFSDMLRGVTGCTVHFPSNLQSVIGSWPDVTAGFGGTNTTVLFDLPATT